MRLPDVHDVALLLGLVFAPEQAELLIELGRGNWPWLNIDFFLTFFSHEFHPFLRMFVQSLDDYVMKD